MFAIEDHGSIVLVRPLTADVSEWIEENVQPEVMWFGGALACESRFVAPLVTGLIEEGFALQ